VNSLKTHPENFALKTDTRTPSPIPFAQPTEGDICPRRAHASSLLAIARLSAIAGITAFFFLLFLAVRWFLFNARKRCRWTAVAFHYWSRCLCRILGIRVRHKGPLPTSGSLIAPNHLGYADILAMGAVTPCLMVARQDLASWPIAGRILQSLELPRVSRFKARDLVQTGGQIKACLLKGQSVCVFLEGTSTGGDRVLPLFSPLLQPAIDCGADVVPAAFRWRTRHPGIQIAEDIAYWKDHQFGRHFWRFLGLQGIEVEIMFGKPHPASDWDRKQLAERIREWIVRLYALEESQPNMDWDEMPSPLLEALPQCECAASGRLAMDASD
jgi:1-acyl-sn-glycerol-3-phosphate acyltransferase